MKQIYLCLALAACTSARANEFQIDSVPAGYTLNHYAFEADADTHRARVVLRYTWPDTVPGGDTGPGLNSVPVQIDGLSYDPALHEVIYSDQGKQSVCATVRPRHFLFWNWTSVSPTGVCTVVSRPVSHVDTGWDHRRREMIDTFLEVP